jgi:hypothetical protein
MLSLCATVFVCFCMFTFSTFEPSDHFHKTGVNILHLEGTDLSQEEVIKFCEQHICLMNSNTIKIILTFFLRVLGSVIIL